MSHNNHSKSKQMCQPLHSCLNIVKNSEPINICGRQKSKQIINVLCCPQLFLKKSIYFYLINVCALIRNVTRKINFLALASYYKVEISWKHKFERREKQKHATKQPFPQIRQQQQSNLNLSEDL